MKPKLPPLRPVAEAPPAAVPAGGSAARPVDQAQAADPLLTEVHQALAKPAWHLGFSAALEARMEADQGAQRRRQMVLAALVALLVYDLFLVNDWLVRPEAFGTALFFRLGLLTPYGLAVLALVHRGVPPAWREGLMASTVVVAMLSSGEIYRHTQAVAGAYDPFVFSLVFMAGNIVFPLRFRAAALASMAGFAAALPGVLSSPLLPHDGRGFALGLLAGTGVFTVLACYRIEHATRQAYLLTLQQTLRAEAAQLRADHMARVSQTDALTGLANRRAFDEALQNAWFEAPTRPGATALLMLDVDHFKRYNDRFGHPAGDDCLRRVAAAMARATRASDLIARVGGEEFAVLLREADEVQVRAQAERLRLAVEALAIPHDGRGRQHTVTISVGAALLPAARWLQPAGLAEVADAALYEAKRAGRNRVQVAGDGRACARSGSAESGQAVPQEAAEPG